MDKDSNIWRNGIGYSWCESYRVYIYQCVILQAVKDNAKIHTAELKIVDSVCHDMMLDPDWRNIADLIFKFIEKTIDKKSGDNYNDNYVSTQAHQGGE